LGAALPAYSFGRYYNPGIHLGCYIGSRLTPQFSLLGMAGYNRFSSNASSSGDTEWWHVSANLKSEIVKNPLRLYINVGPGIYLAKGGALKRGFNFGAGAAYSLKSNWDIELGADFHHVFTRGIDPNFFLTYARMVFRF
jgi:opacity protein-like surface antigen